MRLLLFRTSIDVRQRHLRQVDPRSPACPSFPFLLYKYRECPRISWQEFKPRRALDLRLFAPGSLITFFLLGVCRYVDTTDVALACVSTYKQHPELIFRFLNAAECCCTTSSIIIHMCAIRLRLAVCRCTTLHPIAVVVLFRTSRVAAVACTSNAAAAAIRRVVYNAAVRTATKNGSVSVFLDIRRSFSALSHSY